MNEFYLANRIRQIKHKNSDIRLGIGDDAALINYSSNQELVITTDTLNSNIHFDKLAHAESIAYKAISVNLSDLAAMGATPLYLTLSISMPDFNKKWIDQFYIGLKKQLDEFNIDIIGGDTTQGSLSININAIGVVEKGKALKISNAQAEDNIYVTGYIGDAGLGLAVSKNSIKLSTKDKAYFENSLLFPKPLIEVGINLVNIASAATDISDGLAIDLNNIALASNGTAQIFIEKLPLSKQLLANVSYNEAIEFALNSGDDYQLCFCVPENKTVQLKKAMNRINQKYSCIGRIISNKEKFSGIEILDKNNEKYTSKISGYQHF